jgi:hypothetical protein
MLSEIRAGLTSLSDGAISPARASRVGAKVCGVGQGKYYEATSRGTVFSLIAAWTTNISAGNQIAAAAGASTQFALWNPIGSGKNLSLLKFACWVVSGTTPVPPLIHSYSISCPTIATSVINPITCNNVGLSASCVAKALTHVTGSALTGSSILQYLCVADLTVGAGATVPANLFEPKLVEYLDGSIVIPPGICWVPTWMAQGTSVIGGYSITWEEIPI